MKTKTQYIASLTHRRLPQHVAVIMDGNGRWAQERGLDRLAGHKEGVQAVHRLLEAIGDMGIPYLTIWAFSTDNWKRPAAEVDGLLQLIDNYLEKELPTLHEKGVRLQFLGRREDFDRCLQARFKSAEELTQFNTHLHLTIALSYGGRDEITHAARQLAAAVKEGGLAPEQISEDLFSQYLLLPHLPDPDLLIRTSGEQRLSNFLLWQLSYAELVFVKTLWPDFQRSDLEFALDEYSKRERRYGGVA